MKYTIIEVFDKKMRERIVKVWWRTFPRRWKYGMVKPRSNGDVVICLKGGKIRNIIKEEEIHEYKMINMK